MLHAVVILDIRGAFFAEAAQIVGKLHHIIAADHAVRGVLRPSRTRRAGECLVLIEHVVHADHDLAAPVAEDFLADVNVAERVVAVVIVRKADILRVGRTRRKREAEREDHLQIPLRRMAEVAVFRIGGIERVGRLVVRTVPRQREIDVLGDVAAQHGAEVVSHIARVVALAARNHSRRRIHRTAQHARGLAVNDARHDVEVRLEEPDREAVAQVGHQAPAAVEIDRHGIEVGCITLTVYFDRGILHRMRGDVIRRALEREHPHERPALLDVRIDVVEIDAVRVEGFEPRITARSQVLNSGTRALEMTIRSGVSTVRWSVRRLPNHTAISFTARRATMNCRLARKKSRSGSKACNASRVLSSG